MCFQLYNTFLILWHKSAPQYVNLFFIPRFCNYMQYNKMSERGNEMGKLGKLFEEKHKKRRF